jgi:molybdate transport system substrate-binding protein
MIRVLMSLCLVLPPLVLTSPVQAAELIVLSAGAITGVATAIKPAFEAETGLGVTIRNDTVGGLVRRIKANEAFDVVLVSPAALEQLGPLIDASTSLKLARVGVGVAVKAGDPVPDLSTAEAFTAALRAARSIAYIDPGSGASSGIYLAKLFQSLGIAAEIAPKTILLPGGLAAEALTDGRADIAMQQISELLAVPGVTFAGPLPTEIQMQTTYAGAVAARTEAGADAHAFLWGLTEAPAREAIMARGMTIP